MNTKRTTNALQSIAALFGAFAIIAIAPCPSAASPSPTYLGPLPKGTEDVLMHMPYEMDEEDCSMCHERVDPDDPGGLLMPVNEGCFECHDDMEEEFEQPFEHAPVLDRCTSCHNPHESIQPALLVAEVTQLCLQCHEDTREAVALAPVQHGAIDSERSCLNCHSPHASKVEHLLNQLPYDLCMQCHSDNDTFDHDGEQLVNFETLLEENEEWHAPVASKDCSACHLPHGSQNFRLLVQEYPAKFYSPYIPSVYALCFECHDEEIIRDAETTTHTQFRDGNRNLHYLHVNKTSRGRTCRACHDVHASNQPHLIRDGVPYGSSGWILKLNYSPTPTGGSCARTCHKERSYDYSVLPSPPPGSDSETR